MSEVKYQEQVRLLLDILPEVAMEECFAMHGGTALNLFMRDMPRLMTKFAASDATLPDTPLQFDECIEQKYSIR